MPVTIPLKLNELEDIANKYDTPYYLYDKQSIKNHAKFYMKTFKKYFPNFKQYFAVKALPNPSILGILKKCGMGFDCSSPEEIEIVKFMDLNIQSDKKSSIMYTSNYTSVNDLQKVTDENNDNIIINLDSIDGFYNLLETKNPLPDTICFRYNPVEIFDNNSSDNLNKIISPQQLLLNAMKLSKKIKEPKEKIESDIIKSNIFSGNDTKFGMTKSYLVEAYKLAKTNGIKNFGIHVMSQSNCLDINYWQNLIDDIFDVIYELYIVLEIVIDFIDIGGGIGIPYKPNESDIDLESLVLLIRNRFDYNINKYNMNYEPKLMTECGRYITGPYGWLVARCQSIKKTDNAIFYGLDASMANLMRPGMYQAYHHITVPRLQNYLNSSKMKEANVVGTLCENNDWFAKQRILPCDIKKRDLFVIHDCGAHAYSMGFNYNSKLHCPELLLTKNGILEIREKEDIDYHLQNTLMWINYDNKFMGLFVIILFIVFLSYFNFV